MTENTLYYDPLLREFEKQSDPGNAVPMKRYMKNLFEFYGIKSGPRKEIQRDFLRKYGYPHAEELEGIITGLWKHPKRECQYFAIELLDRQARKAPPDRIGLYEYMITNKSWWDTVDGIAANLAGKHFSIYPELIAQTTRQWMNSGHIWLQRSALLFQLKYKEQTDLAILREYINNLSGSKEFFIQKAIGWVLREYSKTNPEWVKTFVKNHSLAPLSKREALKVITRKNL